MKDKIKTTLTCYGGNGITVSMSPVNAVLEASSEAFMEKELSKDITDHKWSDDDAIMDARADDEEITLIMLEYDTPCITLNKQDAIAIALHFKLIDGAS